MGPNSLQFMWVHVTHCDPQYFLMQQDLKWRHMTWTIIVNSWLDLWSCVRPKSKLSHLLHAECEFFHWSLKWNWSLHLCHLHKHHHHFFTSVFTSFTRVLSITLDLQADTALMVESTIIQQRVILWQNHNNPHPFFFPHCLVFMVDSQLYNFWSTTLNPVLALEKSQCFQDPREYLRLGYSWNCGPQHKEIQFSAKRNPLCVSFELRVSLAWSGFCRIVGIDGNWLLYSFTLLRRHIHMRMMVALIIYASWSWLVWLGNTAKKCPKVSSFANPGTPPCVVSFV